MLWAINTAFNILTLLSLNEVKRQATHCTSNEHRLKHIVYVVYPEEETTAMYAYRDVGGEKP